MTKRRSTLIAIETTFADQAVTLTLPPHQHRLYWLGGEVPCGVPIAVVLYRGSQAEAKKLRQRLVRYGYRAKIIHRKEPPKPTPPVAISEVAPCCKGCRERDQVICDRWTMKMFGEPFCRRCKEPLSRVKPHRLPPNDFD